MDVGISHNHGGIVEGETYIPADVYNDDDGNFLGLHLVLDQRGNFVEPSQWHLHQDFVVTLGLKLEVGVWVRPEDGYTEVARLTRKTDGSPALLTVRASYLRDYLCARDMVLYVTSCRSREEVSESADHIKWPDGHAEESSNGDRWQGHVTAIHEGGEEFGSQIAVFHAARTDVDPDADVPILGPPTAGNVESESWTIKHRGRKLFRIDGQFWRNEFVDPASSSPIMRGDKVEPTVFFTIDAEGKKESAVTLKRGDRWLWFRPDVINTLSDRRGGSLKWHTRETGEVTAVPGYGVHFGVNSLGLVNVYAKDIALLPEWQQRIWAGYNLAPDGKLSEELYASQVRARPADTQAPEAFLARALKALAETAKRKLGVDILREHRDVDALLSRIHRFRATDEKGLYALAKDLAKLTADRLDEKQLQAVVAPPKGDNWKGLKSLEKVLASKLGDAAGRSMVGPLFGIYELRLADAHLSNAELGESLQLAGVDPSTPYIMQGRDLLHSCVSTIFDIAKAIDKHW